MAQQADPVRRALRPLPADVDVALVCVFRRHNAPHVRALLESLPAGAECALWCLDGQPPADLAPTTVGTGPGNRSVLLNRLVAGLVTEPDALVLADDDIRFAIGDLASLVEAGRRLGLDVFQPAHLASSHANWEFVRRTPLSFARVTDFVEQGPLVVLSPLGRRVVLPLPEDIGMGWGVEVRWWRRAAELDARLGVVDAVAVRHLVPAASGYDRAESERTLAAELDRAGLSSLEQLQVVRERVGVRAARRLAGGPST